MKRLLLFLLIFPFYVEAQVPDFPINQGEGFDGYALQDVEFGQDFSYYPHFYELTAKVTTRADSVIFDHYGPEHFERHVSVPDSIFAYDTLHTDRIDTVYTLIRAYHNNEAHVTLRTYTYADHFWAVAKKKAGESADMALSDILYATASWTAPSSDLTDFIGYVDLSLLPQDWWDEVDTSDGQKMRVAKDDAPEGDTSAAELAFDVRGFDQANQEGHLFFLWSGTLSSTSPDDIRIYPAKSALASYGAADTYGRNAVYANAELAISMHEDPAGTAPQFTDRTGNGYDGTAQGSLGSGDVVSHKAGSGIDFEGTDAAAEYISFGQDYQVLAGDNFTALIWISPLSAADIGQSSSPLIGNENESDKWAAEEWSNEGVVGFTEGGELSTDFDNHPSPYGSTVRLGLVKDGNTWRSYEDGVQQDTASYSIVSEITFDSFGNENGFNYFRGIASNLVLFEAQALSSDWLSLDYQNQNDPGTFWGTWSIEGESATVLNLSGSVDSSFSASGNLSQQSALSGAIAPVFAISGNMAETATLAGEVGSESILSADMSKHSNLAGNIDSGFALSGNVSKQASLTGQIDSQFALSANAIQKALLSGGIETASSIIGDLIKRSTLMGTSAMAFGLSGDLSEKATISGQINSETALQGSLSEKALLSGGITTASALSGNIIIVEDGVVSLSGSMDTAFSMSGNLSVTKQVQGVIETQTGMSGDLIKKATLSGDVLTVSSLTADASIQKTLAGTILVRTELSGVLTPVSSVWAGRIDISHRPLYTLSFKVRPMHEISINERPFFTINITDTDQ